MYAWNFFYAIVARILSSTGFSFVNGTINIDKLLVQPLIHGHRFVLNMGGWFVVPLFLCQVYTVLIRFFTKKFAGITKDSIIMFISFTIGCYGVKLANDGIIKSGSLLLLIGRTMYFLPYFIAGYFYHHYLKAFFSTLSNSLLLGSLLVISCVLTFLHKGVYYSITVSWCLFYGINPLIVYLLGFIAIAFWIRLSKIFEPLLGNSKMVQSIADNSYSIMINQFAGFFLVKSFFYILNQRFGLFMDFDINAYHTNIWYYYFPYNMVVQTTVLYVMAGIMVPILLQKVVNLSEISMHKLFHTFIK